MRHLNGLLVDPETGWVTDAGPMLLVPGKAIAVHHGTAVLIHTHGPIAVLSIPLPGCN